MDMPLKRYHQKVTFFFYILKMIFKQLTEIDSVNFPKNDELKEVSDFSFESMTLNVADEAAARAFLR